MMLEKMFETNTLVFRQAYREGKLEEARTLVLQDVKKVRFGDIEKWEKEYVEHMDLFKACMLGTLFLILQWLLFFLARATFHCSMNWAYYVVGAEIIFFGLGICISSEIDSKKLEYFTICFGALSGIITLIGLWAIITALLFDRKEIKEHRKNYEKGPLAYCMLVYPNEDAHQTWYFKECKAKVLEVNAKNEYLAHLAIGNEINEWEEARQKKLARYKELRDIFMWAKMIFFGVMTLVFFLGYKGIIYMDTTPYFILRSIVSFIISFILISIFQNRFSQKYNKLLNKEISVPEIYKVYFYEE